MKVAARCLASLLWLAGAPVAGAAELGETIPGHPGLTYFDMAKLLVTDLDPSGDGAEHAIVPFTHIEGKDSTVEAQQDVTLDASDIDAMAIPGDPSRIVVLVDLGHQEGFVAHAELLALFSLAPAPRLLDVVEVGTAESIGFAQKEKPAMLAARAPLILIDSEHDDADLSLSSVEMIFIRGDRFQFIGAFSTFDEKLCSYNQMEPWSVGIVPTSGAYPAIHVSVQERIAATGAEGCGDQQKTPRSRVTTYQANYRWDPRALRFTTPSTQLKQLARENDKAP
ncbi:hypothetical protein [Methylocapsa sp. S129]|uniref:hypothetical protein n=1 Tax=Methylocapsa sp. S129 TaxID=1641869 RepID=UPI00131ADBAF|nr:hypothetical protein [Methylocapsa sp. S129]